MQNPHHILKQVWGFDAFRPMQEDIIQAVLKGDDVLALLPTGGGKSICFQVPALCLGGLCIVVSPLIALMKDQVEQLKKRGVQAQAIYSGMSQREIDIALSNCMYGQVSFLYLSPERLKTDMFRERVQKMPVTLLAIDEAHCISQWGYDFRPPYLEIAEIRELLPENTPLIALTATATKEVKADIIEKLQLKNCQQFQKSFARANLSYNVRMAENKESKLLEILQRVPGTAVVYARNRKKTVEVALWLKQNGISADFYHAGLDQKIRSKKQDDWINNRIRVIVSTNAFGMGIDKADVRLVAHIDLPDTLEAYYQEAGRAGRDEKKAYAVAIINELDAIELRKRFEQSNPTIDFIKKVYQCLANYFKIAVGAGELVAYELNIGEFASSYDLPPLETYSALKKLEQESLLMLNEAFSQPSRLHILIDNRSLYDYQLKYPSMDIFIKTILRMYGGELFSSYLSIDEQKIAKQLAVNSEEVLVKLKKLKEHQVIDYEMQSDRPTVTFLSQRYDSNRLPINAKKLKERTQLLKSKLESVINYSLNTNRCRTQQLLEYFDEISYAKCGVCDVCITKAKSNPSSEQERLRNQLFKLENPSFSIKELKAQLKPKNDEILASLIAEMLDSGELKILENGSYQLI